MGAEQTKGAYAAAGVNIDIAAKAKELESMPVLQFALRS